jgi:hypothetical protein
MPTGRLKKRLVSQRKRRNSERKAHAHVDATAMRIRAEDTVGIAPPPMHEAFCSQERN